MQENTEQTAEMKIAENDQLNSKKRVMARVLSKMLTEQEIALVSGAAKSDTTLANGVEDWKV